MNRSKRIPEIGPGHIRTDGLSRRIVPPSFSKPVTRARDQWVRGIVATSAWAARSERRSKTVQRSEPMLAIAFFEGDYRVSVFSA